MSTTADTLAQLVNNTDQLLQTVQRVKDTFEESKNTAVEAAGTATSQAGVATAKAGEASASESLALQYRNEAQNAAQSAASIAFQSGTVTTDSRYGVTITHNKGDLLYTPKATVIGTAAQAMKAGEISFVPAANTVVVYNTGDPVTIQYELSGVAP